ncbi:chorismate synthase [Actinomycetaceae bacterium TAE3-ERU4]|nr:chorismate synthase [Actinomycetaceae bacterium TAE3-ERU4]
MLRWITAGESHGPALVGIIDGVPAGLEITKKDFEHQLWRRRQGAGRGARQKFEQDNLQILGGIRHGMTTGSPIALVIENSEWPKWKDVMSSDPIEQELLRLNTGRGDERELARSRPLTRPRPGHADLAGAIKYQHFDARNVLERASARETAARVAVGTVARQILKQSAGIEVIGHLRALGEIDSTAPLPLPNQAEALDLSAVRCLEEQSAKKMLDYLEEIKKSSDTCGGIVEVCAYGVPVGLGSHIQHDRRLDADIAAGLMSIQAVKGVEIGLGMQSGRTRGSQAQDEIYLDENGNWKRSSNRAGGVEGGVSNGQPIVARCAIKPISTVPRALRTVDWNTSEPASANHQRSDVCAAVPAVVIAEACLSLVLAKHLLQRAGGDTLEQIKRNLETLNRDDTRA